MATRSVRLLVVQLECRRQDIVGIGGSSVQMMDYVDDFITISDIEVRTNFVIVSKLVLSLFDLDRHL